MLCMMSCCLCLATHCILETRCLEVSFSSVIASVILRIGFRLGGSHPTHGAVGGFVIGVLVNGRLWQTPGVPLRMRLHMAWLESAGWKELEVVGGCWRDPMASPRVFFFLAMVFETVRKLHCNVYRGTRKKSVGHSHVSDNTRLNEGTAFHKPRTTPQFVANP